MSHVALIRQTFSANVCNNGTLVYDRDEEGVLRVIERIDAGFAGCNANQECGMFKFDNFDSALNYTGKVRRLQPIRLKYCNPAAPRLYRL